MNAFGQNTGECQETSGFLFSHRCGSIAVRECSQCAKSICQEHSVDLGGMLVCVTCAKQQREAPPPDQQPGSDTSPPYSTGGGYYNQSPYFYSDTWYSNSGMNRGHWRRHHNDPRHGADAGLGDGGTSDFTDSDEAMTRGEEPDRNDMDGFENDMGGS